MLGIFGKPNVEIVELLKLLNCYELITGVHV